MTKLILAGIVLLSFTACNERVGRGINAPVHTVMDMQEDTEEISTLVQENEVMIINDIPILENDLPILPTPKKSQEPLSTEKGMNQAKETSTSYQNTGGLDIANIRISNSHERTRIVFDSYDAGAKASASAAYTYEYDASTKSLSLILKGYATISALEGSKARTYPQSSLVKKIYLDNTNTSNLKIIIVLKNDVHVNIFDIKEPGRIVIDISLGDLKK